MIRDIKKYELTGKLLADKDGGLLIEVDGVYHNVYDELFDADLLDGDMTKRPYIAKLTIEFNVEDIK